MFDPERDRWVLINGMMRPRFGVGRLAGVRAFIAECGEAVGDLRGNTATRLFIEGGCGVLRSGLRGVRLDVLTSDDLP